MASNILEFDASVIEAVAAIALMVEAVGEVDATDAVDEYDNVVQIEDSGMWTTRNPTLLLMNLVLLLGSAAAISGHDQGEGG